MAQVCPCGETLTVHVTVDYLITYCQDCGSEVKSPRPKGFSPPKFNSDIISISRASILKKVNAKVVEDTKRPKQVKQVRDRTNYVPQRGSGRR